MGSAFVVGSHHLARQFARAGHDVAHVSTPISPAHRLAIKHPEIKARFDIWQKGGLWRAERLFEYVPMGLLPWKVVRHLPAGGVRSRISLAGVKRRLEENGFGNVDLLLVDQPKMVGIEKLLPATHVVYRATDLYKDMEADEHMISAAREIANTAELLVGTSEPVVNELKSNNPGKRYLLLENGVDFDSFATHVPMPPEYAYVPAPRLVYVGALDQRFDFALILEVAKALPNASIVLVGPLPEQSVAEKLKTAANIHLLGARPYEQVPAFYQHSTIGLLPFSAHAANAGRSPMKLYEYGAARLPVVAVWTPELSRRALPFVSLARTYAEFIAGISHLLSSPQARHEAAQLAFKTAEQMGWAGIAESLLRAVTQAA